jgi:CRISPR-associated endonuclease/helicase Cas3
MRRAGHEVLHLSTALAPAHREPIVARIKARLEAKDGLLDWTLVATSCVECGMDFSLRKGFRESCSTASFIQTGGRVSRGAEHLDAEVWDFRVLDDLLTAHPGFTVSRHVLDTLFEEGSIDRLSPSDLAKEAMRREVTAKGEQRASAIVKAEEGMEYPEVASLCRVIDADTRIVVIDPKLVEALRQGERVPTQKLLRYSVQVWSHKIPKLPIVPVFDRAARSSDDSPDLYAWTAAYDPDFLGYMAGVLPLLEQLKDGCFLA